MNHIVTTSQVQRKIGEITANIGGGAGVYIVTNRGMGKIVMLPYFDGCDDKIADYMEDYEIEMNKAKLVDELKKSSASGQSGLKI